MAFEHQRTSFSAKFAQFTKLAEQLNGGRVGGDWRYWGRHDSRGALVIRVSGPVRACRRRRQPYQQVAAILMDEMDAAARASAFQVTRTAQKNYLSGPRPKAIRCGHQ